MEANKHYNTTRFFIVMGFLFSMAITLPYILSYFNMGDDHFFIGLLVNPLDGLSYFAKIYQGTDGNWILRLPFTAENQEGAYLFLYYLFLGHISSITNLSITSIYHTARVINSLLLVISLAIFSNRIFTSGSGKKFSFLILLFGSGLGWINSTSQVLPPDFWIAEAYPFLSAYSNPHFPLTLTLMLWLIYPMILSKPNPSRKPWAVICVSLFLSIISPFGVLVVLLVNSSAFAVEYFISNNLQIINIKDLGKKLYQSELPFVVIGGIPYSIYVLLITKTINVFAAWHAQNLTPAPPIHLFILGFSPGLLIAIIAWFRRDVFSKRSSRTLLIWILWGAILTYLPFGLQRRMMLGLYIPITYLAITLVMSIPIKKVVYKRIVLIIYFIIVLPSNILMLFTSFYAYQTKDPSIYITRDEHKALMWIRQNTPDNSLVLAEPDEGRYIPAFTGRRVVYGHPYETANAEDERLWVEEVFSYLEEESRVIDALHQKEVDYLLLGSGDGRIGADEGIEYLDLVYENETFIVYQVDD